MESIRLDGKVAIVTGGGSGIGQATSVLLARRGASVVVADRDEEGGAATVAMIDEGRAIFVPTDVSNESSCNEAVERAVSTFGRLDIAHNNAGINIAGINLADVDLESWNRVISVCLTGVFLGMKSQIPAMLESGGGSIINTSSGEGVTARPGHAAYVSAKHGVIGLTRAAAMEYSASGIRVNSVLPGAIETGLARQSRIERPGVMDRVISEHPIGRIGQPEEVAEAVAWLASDSSSFVTGSALVVDGGYTIH